MSRVELRERHEAVRLDVCRGRGHRATVELVQTGTQLGAGREPEPQAVTRAPRRRTQEESLRLAGDVLPHELPIGLEAAGREDERTTHRQLA